MKKILGLLSEGDGELSTMRVMTFIIILAILIPAVVTAIRTQTGVELSTEQIALILGVLGVKTAQRAVESKTEKKESPSAPA